MKSGGGTGDKRSALALIVTPRAADSTLATSHSITYTRLLAPTMPPKKQQQGTGTKVKDDKVRLRCCQCGHALLTDLTLFQTFGMKNVNSVSLHGSMQLI